MNDARWRVPVWADAQRFEAKYIVNELHAQAIRDHILPYVTADPHARQGAEYSVTSLYLDTRALNLYWASRQGEKNRFKLRIRNYSDAPHDPAFVEIKRRVDRAVVKQRARVTNEIVQRFFLQGRAALTSEIVADARQREALFEFRDLMEHIAAQPVAYVRYQREAYMSSYSEAVRITFDRRLMYRPYAPEAALHGDGHWRRPAAPEVIMEIKFSGRYPEWVQQTIDRFDLMRDSYAKYVVCVDAMGKEGILSVPPGRMVRR